MGSSSCAAPCSIGVWGPPVLRPHVQRGMGSSVVRPHVQGGGVTTTIRTVCAHDCPDQCSLIATVEAGRVVRVQGDPEHPMTAGFACTKVNREHELVHSPERVL